jgi:hypothetical protein
LHPPLPRQNHHLSIPNSTASTPRGSISHIAMIRCDIDYDQQLFIVFGYC